jgi:Flp pilus assembly secretin CpaC
MRKARESSMALVFKRLILALVLAFCAVAVIAPRPAPAADVLVILDQAKLINLPEKVATIVVGNPLIAEASLQAGGLVVITGKGYGMTNFIVLDRAGAVMMEKSILVQGPSEHVVVVHRGILRESYSCTPICEPQITLGDNSAYLGAALTDSMARNTQAQAAAAHK